MKVGALDASSLVAQTPKREQDQNVQNVFLAVLASAGRAGYASAEAPSNDQPLTESIKTSWNSWFSGERNGRYQEAKNPDALNRAYGEILVRAQNANGYVDPRRFLRSLSSDDLKVVQNVQWLANKINVGVLTEEGALNLLIPPAAQVDLNGDGFTRTGAAYGLKFPDSNTPAGVVAAWEEATQGMSFGDTAAYQLQMKSPLLWANITLDENGAFLRRSEPGDSEFKNPLAAADFSYVGLSQSSLDYLENFKDRIPPEQYRQDKSFWTNFRRLLTENKAA